MKDEKTYYHIFSSYQNIPIMKLAKLLLIAYLVNIADISYALNSSLNSSSNGVPFQENKSTIVDRSNSQMNINANNGVLQEEKVTGIVTNGSTDEPIAGATVTIYGTARGTITDADGVYTLDNTKPGNILEFSFKGFYSDKITVSSKTVINMQLTINPTEFVEVGYGTLEKSYVTGSIVSLDAEAITSTSNNNVLQAIQGRAAGVDITSNERPGELGNVNIRGVSSFYLGSSPLYVVDGILLSVGGIETVNTSDIESIDILKDVAASAIYGFRGSHGVIQVTTKKGKAGKLRIHYSGSVTVETLHDRAKMMDAGEYIEWKRWANYYQNPLTSPRGDNPDLSNDYIFAYDPEAWNNVLKGWGGGTWDGSKVATTNWVGMVSRTAVSHEHNLSISGGTKKLKVYASFGYLNNDGTSKGEGYTRYTSMVNLNFNPLKWLELGANINATFSIQQYGLSNKGSSINIADNIYMAAKANLPYAVPYDSNGNRIIHPGGYSTIVNMVDEWKYNDNERKTSRAMGCIYAQLNILSGLKYRVNYGPGIRDFKNGVFIDNKSSLRFGTNYASLRKENNSSWTLDNLLYYDKKFGRHTLGANLLWSYSAYKNDYSYMQDTNLPENDQKWNALDMSDKNTLESWALSSTESKSLSYMGRVNYGLEDKYLLTLSGFWDDYKLGFSPSAALAWRMDQEKLFRNMVWINQLKLRVGIGKIYNHNEFKTGSVQLAYFAKENTTQLNVGIDYGFLNNRFSGTIDLYTSKTNSFYSPSTISGNPIIWDEMVSINNKGIELIFNSVNVQTKDFSWRTSLNMAWQKDKIISLMNGKEDVVGENWFIGESMGVIYDYDSNGLWHEEDATEMALFNTNGHHFKAGMVRPVDQNHDHRITPNDDRVIIGHTRPRWTVGMNNTFTYKNFDLSFFLYGRLDYTYKTGSEMHYGDYAQRKIDYYTENNKDAEYQRPGVFDLFNYSSLGYRSGSFIKIRNISLGYTVPKPIANKLGMQSLRIYAQVKNPGMLYSKINWLDMDLSTSNNPVSNWNRGFVFGVNVGF